MTLGIHSADVFNYLLGPIYSAFAFSNKLYIPAPVDDVTTTIFKYESGVLGYLGSNYASPKAVWFYIYGTEANLLFTVTPPELPFEEYLLWWEGVDQDSSLKIFKKGQTGSESLPFEYGNPILEEVEEFAAALKYGRNILHVFYGHVHRMTFVNWRGVPFTSLPSLNHQIPLNAASVQGEYCDEPPAYGVVQIEDDQLTVHFNTFLQRNPLHQT